MPFLKSMKSKVDHLTNKVYSIDYQTTFFEGGLGSQILNYIEWKNKRNLSSNSNFTDLSYFANNNDIYLESGLSHWRWRLDSYGIGLHHLLSYSRPRERKIMRLRKPSYEQRAQYILENKLHTVDHQILKELALTQRRDFFEQKIPELRGKSYGVIHIRKGDFLQVASHIVNVDEICTLLKKVYNLLPNVLIFVSDGELGVSERNSIREVVSNAHLLFLDQAGPQFEPVEVHDLMRLADLRITSNSSFSYSASILRADRDSITFIPSRFYKLSEIKMNSLFQESTDFSILR